MILIFSIEVSNVMIAKDATNEGDRNIQKLLVSIMSSIVQQCSQRIFHVSSYLNNSIFLNHQCCVKKEIQIFISFELIVSI